MTTQVSEETNGLEIAVVGLAARYSGAGSVEEFWRNLRGGVESVSRYTDEEVLAAGTDAAVLAAPNFVKAGGVLEGVELFDAAFFGYSPREAEILDPQHRIFLECAWEALEHAGYDSESYHGLIGVYAGGGMGSYLLNIYSNPEVAAAADPLQLANGNDKDHLTSRVAYKLNLKGPAVTVQSACSTSLVAVHTACQGLLSGACDVALAGGVSISLPQRGGYLYEEGGILSADGHCRAFDAAATGTVGGSGAGVVVLKRLEDALADGDRVYAVIKGSAINNDGSAKVGYTAPSVEGQARVIRAAQEMAEVEPDTISYVEAHGTGTALGDPIEIAALTMAFRARTPKKGFCAIGSVKTNIGHADAAAGVAGLIKTVLALSHGEIPPSLHFKEPNPQIDFAGSPFYVNAKLSEWKANGRPRRAGVSSFGMGGTNAHVVLEEAPPAGEGGEARAAQLLVLSAKTETALEAMTSNLADALRRDRGIELADVAFTLQTGRRALGHRRFVVCESAQDAADALERRDPKRVFTRADEPGERPVVFMFPGQGAQHVNMGLGLYRGEPVFREQVDACSELLRPHLGLDLRDVLYPAEREAAEAARKLTQTSVTQPALFVVEYALAKLWMSWGVKPEAMIGHSVGEYVAACLAGVFALEDALRLIAGRGRLMQSLPAGAMLAVRLPESEVSGLLRDGRLSLAAVNGASQCVVSGPPGAVEELAGYLGAREVSHSLLRTSHAFHSEMMEPILGEFTSLFAGVRLSPPSVPYLSNVTGDWVTDEEATSPQYWAQHLRRTVRFSDGLRELFKQPHGVLLEVGPGETLGALVNRHPEKPAGQSLLHSLSHPDKGLADVASMLNALGQLWLSPEARVDWAGFHAGRRRRRVPLPTYPFERRRYWVERRPLGAAAPRPATPRRKPEVADWFYVPVWKQSALPPLGADGAGGEELADWLVFGDDRGIGAALAARLRGEGANVLTVTPGDGFGRRGEDEYTVDPARREDYESLLDELQARGRSPQRIVSLWGVGRGAGAAASNGAAEDLLDRTFYSLLFLAQALGGRRLMAALDGGARPSDLRVCIISDHLQKVLDDEEVVPEKALILGACRVIHQEYPDLTCRSIDVAPARGAADEARLVGQLLAEVRGAARDAVVAYRGRRRWVQTFDPVRLPARPGVPARLRERGVYLITGGLGGIALEIGQYLARTVRARLVLLGRSAFPGREQWADWLAGHDEGDATSRKIRTILSLEAQGAEVLVVRADVSDLGQTAAALDVARERFGAEIHGVFHLAGAPPGSLIQRKTREMAAAVLAPKVAGTRVLQRLFEGKGLDFLMLFSSLRSLTGGAGTFDYTAANAFLDAFANHYHSPEGTAVMAVDWDGWPEVGMSLGAQARAESGARGGEDGLTAAEGVEAFARLLDSDLPQVAVSVCDLQTVVEREQSFDAAEALRELEKPRAARDTYSRPEMGTPFVAPESRAERVLAAIWEELLGIERVGVHDNFFELGGDSVISIRIIAKAKQAGLDLTPKQVFDHQTIAELAAAAGAGVAADAEQGPVTGAVPLTPIQHWFFEQNPADPHHHNQALMLEVRRPIDAGRMEEAVRALLAHHDALRLRFRPSARGWEQFNAAPDGEAPFTRVALKPAAGAGPAIEAAAAEWQASLNFTDGPLLRVVWFDLGEDRPGRLLLVIHHLAVDAISWRVLLEDLESAYGQLGRGGPVQLPAKTTSFKEWAELLERHGRTDAAPAGADYWLDPRRAEVAPLPADHRAGENTVASTSAVTVSLGEEETRALLQDVPRAFGTQINDALLAALGRAFARWTGDGRLLVDLEGHGREPLFDGVDLSRTVGWFTTIYPVLLDVTAAAEPGEALRAVHEQLSPVRRGGIDYGVLRYLRADREISDRLRSLPQAEVCFLYLGQQEHPAQDDAPFGPAEESCGPVISPRARRSYLFEVIAGVSGGRLRVSWDYSRHLHRAETVEALAEEFAETLRALAAAAQSAGDRAFAPPPSEFGWGADELDDIMAEIRKSAGVVGLTDEGR